jgi:soluble lytic murein transglycosylase-like protein
MITDSKLSKQIKAFTLKIFSGFVVICHSSLAILGITVLIVIVTLYARPNLRDEGELKLINWLQMRQFSLASLTNEISASERATATNPLDLPKQQAALAYWLSKKYRIAPEPLSALITETYEIGDQTKLEPTLILAVMAIESGFNPFAQSSVGAQGLMQVMTKIHKEKYEFFGGKLAAFDPLTNIRIGAEILKTCITKFGSINNGLKCYVGAANGRSDGGYSVKVLSEFRRLQLVVQGRQAPMFSGYKVRESYIIPEARRP